MKDNVFIEQIKKITLSSNDHTRMQSIDSVVTYPFRVRKDLVSEKEEIKCNNIMKQYKNNKLQRCYKRKHKRA